MKKSKFGIAEPVDLATSPGWLEDANSGKSLIKNSDGTVSTVKTIGFDADGKYYKEKLKDLHIKRYL